MAINPEYLPREIILRDKESGSTMRIPFREEITYGELLKEMEKRGLLSYPVRQMCIMGDSLFNSLWRMPWDRLARADYGTTLYAAKKTEEWLELTLRDYATGRSITESFLPDKTFVSHLITALQDDGLLSIPVSTAGVYADGTVYDEGINKLSEIPGLHSGMRLDVYYNAWWVLQGTAAQHLVGKPYELIFRLMVDGTYRGWTKFVCYGYERWRNIIWRMQEQGLLDKQHWYEIENWPDYLVYDTLISRYDGNRVNTGRFLCEMDPKQGSVFVIQWKNRLGPTEFPGSENNYR